MKYTGKQFSNMINIDNNGKEILGKYNQKNNFKMVILVLDNVEFKVKSRKLTGYYIMINSLFL